MPLTSGTRLGTYEIVALLGAGGMGEVYRAKDTNLGRDVALKTLPESVTHDADRLARFRREAQVLASLNHPQIGSIYGLEESSGHRFLVLELIEGETLAARIRRGPLALEEALPIAREIAEALAAAHDKGIVHRDLKPANIALTAQDRVKVLDFGLAKAADAAVSGADPLNSPTITSPAMLTGIGVILGTAAYMSPEQARGRAADKRSDIWAFGCVLYEMLTGKRPFGGDDVSDTLASVLKSDPDLDALPSSLPSSIRTLIEGCLAKDPRDRISDISTALFILRRPTSTQPDRPVRTRSWFWLAWAALFVVGIAAVVPAYLALSSRAEPTPAQVARFAIPVAGNYQLTMSRRAVAVAPDGSRIVYSADGRLYSRALSEIDSRPIPGGDPGILPAFSPDGQSIVFWTTDGLLKRLPVGGGVPVMLCETGSAPFSIDWSAHGVVYIQPGTGIWRVASSGGTPEMLVRLSPVDGLANAVQMLPDGDTVLFALSRESSPTVNFWDKAQIVVQSLKTGERRTVVQAGSYPRYLPTGHIVYMIEGTLLAVPFDVRTLTATGGPVPVVEGIRRSAPGAGYAGQFELSDSGILAYVPGPARAGQDDVFIYDRKGEVTSLKLPRGAYSFPRVSPDGKRLALETSDGKLATVSVYDLSGTSSLRRLTFGGNNRLPIWSADGKRIAFQSDREGDRGIFWQPVDGSAAERLTRAEAGTSHVPEAWRPNDDLFLYSITKGMETSLWTYSIRDRKTALFADVVSPAFPTNAVFSPDGKWVAYQSGDFGTGEATLYVQPYPATGVKYEIARGGRALWSPSGTELVFVPAPSQFMSVSIQTSPSFSFSSPTPVPRRFGLAPPGSPRPYDFLPDGRFVSVDAVDLAIDQRTQQIQVVLNWFEELKAKVAAGK